MAKSKRKPSAAQRNKEVIEAAKVLKKAGILSAKANLHSGRYVSRGVLAKVKQYQHAAALDYATVKVSKKVYKEAKERGYQVVGGNRIIGPKDTAFKKRIAEGKITGVKPVRGGMMEEVIMPHGVMDMYSLVEQLEGGIDDLKMPGEQFAFKFYGFESYRAFRDSDDLLDYLRHYKSIFTPSGSLKAEDLQDEFDALTIFRLHPSDVDLNIRGPARRKADKRRARAEGIRTQQDRRYRKRTMAEKLDAMEPARAARIRKKLSARQTEKWEAIKRDPKKYEAAKAAARERAKKSYEKRKK